MLGGASTYLPRQHDSTVLESRLDFAAALIATGDAPRLRREVHRAMNT